MRNEGSILMEMTWNSTMKQVVDALGLQKRPWLIDPFTEIDASEFLEGRQIGDLPLGELARRNVMQNRPSIVSGFQFLLSSMAQKQCLFDIWDGQAKEEEPGREKTGLFAFPAEGAKKFLLIIPGGGYFNVCSFVEGFPIAESCVRQGISAFVLHYRTSGFAHYPNPQEDAAQAVRFILKNREQFGLAGTDYAVCGFSAGGHLAASFATESLGYARFGVPRPQAVLLGYPVITMGELTHEGSRALLLGENADDPAVREKWSVEKQVTGNYPPTFVWNCAGDDCVPAENSAMLEAALTCCGVPVRHEVFLGTVHGWGLGDGTPAEGWLDRAIRFWEENTSGGSVYAEI